MTEQDVLKLITEHRITTVRLWFTDVLGQLKGFVITPRELDCALSEGMGFDGSSIEGFARIEESDMVALPDPSTCRLLPTRPGEPPSLVLFCNVATPDRRPYDGDPRYVLKRNLERASKLGYTFNVGPELEYFYFRNDQGTEILDRGNYFDVSLRDLGCELREKTVARLEAMGIKVEYSHHEVAPSQHEIDLRYGDALTMADAAMVYRWVVKEIAQEHGVYATFMPKPLFGENGSGMHVHQSLFRGNSNAFFSPTDPSFLSPLAKSYTAGLLRYARELVAVTNQWVNSYKRLVPGYEAPVYLSWARHNRSTMVRVPMIKPGKEKSTRIEFRVPDPSCNPYLAFSVMLAAGLQGIEDNIPLPPPREEDLFELTEAERSERGIETLPGDLLSAIRETEKSKLVRACLGEHVFGKFIANKLIEWDRYRISVTQFEKERYLPLL